MKKAKPKSARKSANPAMGGFWSDVHPEVKPKAKKRKVAKRRKKHG